MTEEQKQLIADNHNLIYSFLQRYHLDEEEYYDLAAIGLCNAAKSYKNDISKFSTYAYKCMFNIVCKEIKKKQTLTRIPEDLIISYHNTFVDEYGELSEYLDYIPSDINMEECVSLKVDIRNSLDKLNLSERDLLIFELLIEGYSATEIGRIAKCDRGTVARVRSKITGGLKGET